MWKCHATCGASPWSSLVRRERVDVLLITAATRLKGACFTHLTGHFQSHQCQCELFPS